MSSFDLKRLRYFLTVAELGSVTRAASELHVAQPALSHQMHLLEDEIGTQLFSRGPQGVRLTDAGRKLAHESRSLLDHLKNMRERVRADEQEPEGAVVLGVAQTIGPIITAPLLELTRERLPRVQLQIRELMSSDIPELLRSGSIAFALSYAIPSGRGVRSRNIFVEDLFLVGTRSAATRHFPGGVPQQISFRELADVPLYLSARYNGFREDLERIARQKKIRLNVAAEVDSVAIRKELALSGAGFTILSPATIRREMSRHVIAVPIVQPNVRRTVCFVHRNVSTLARAEQELARLLTETLDRLLSTGAWTGTTLPAGGIPRLV